VCRIFNYDYYFLVQAFQVESSSVFLIKTTGMYKHARVRILFLFCPTVTLPLPRLPSASAAATILYNLAASS
jgi:hypothetical protein